MNAFDSKLCRNIFGF